jgi:hypothetical protein
MDYYDGIGNHHHVPDGTPDDPIYVRPAYSGSLVEDVGDWLAEHFPRVAVVYRLAVFVVILCAFALCFYWTF